MLLVQISEQTCQMQHQPISPENRRMEHMLKRWSQRNCVTDPIQTPVRFFYPLVLRLTSIQFFETSIARVYQQKIMNKTAQTNKVCTYACIMKLYYQSPLLSDHTLKSKRALIHTKESIDSKHSFWPSWFPCKIQETLGASLVKGDHATSHSIALWPIIFPSFWYRTHNNDVDSTSVFPSCDSNYNVAHLCKVIKRSKSDQSSTRMGEDATQ